MIDIIFAEFGAAKRQPDLENIRYYFPNAEINVFDESNCVNYFADSPFWGHYMNDYHKVEKLLESKADIAIAFDADIKIVDNRVRVLELLARKFGLCLPANPRKLVKVDTEIGSHSDGMLDESLGMGYAFNMTPIVFNTKHYVARQTLEKYCEIMIENPVRGPLAMWRAAYSIGFFPCLLPPQWCVCKEDIGIGNEIILHIGHKDVARYYGV
ncbi:hypothetical protein FJZ33_00105 [Candidatus Poribacteria bacterium]|nr:hypothetical protein [Candidatus Poribacteria bacterium]